MTFEAVLGGQKTWHVHCADVLDGLRLLPGGCVHVCVTSPPYFGLRDYGVEGQIGSEPTPAEFVATMVRVFGEVRRALRDDGCLFLNLGDTYASNSHAGRKDQDIHKRTRGNPGDGDCSFPPPTSGRKPPAGYKSGDLMGVPWAVARALREDGWHLRAEVIWHKLSCMPESLSGWRWERCRVKVASHLRAVCESGRKDGAYSEGRTAGWATKPSAQWSDCPGCPKCEPHGGLVLRRGAWRPTRAHEQIFLLTKSAKYYCDPDAVRTPLAAAHDDPAKANPRSVQTFRMEPLKGKHYACFPPSLPDFFIRAATSQEGVCPGCGAPWARVIEKAKVGSYHDHAEDGVQYGLRQNGRGPAATWDAGQTLGWRPTCSCPPQAPTPALVLDPFSGAGTTGLTARRLGRRYLGIELNADYVALGNRRILDDMPLLNGGGA